MRSLVILAPILIVATDSTAPKSSRSTFAKADEGKLPAGWTAARTGKGEGSVWKVVADASTPSQSGYALAQTAEGPPRLFNLCLQDDSRFLNGEISVRFKVVDGKVDQGGGVCWRVQDANNYYVARYSPLERDFRLYQVVDGLRFPLATEQVSLTDSPWHTLSIRHQGDRVECLLDGRRYLEATDVKIKEAGRVGLWTRADARTHFDELIVTPK